MIMKKNLALIFVFPLLLCACAYIVTPDLDDAPTATGGQGWAGVVTKVDRSAAGDLHIDIAIHNETADWSAMQAVPGTPAVLTASDGKTTNCDTVFVGTGGNSLAPGFQMRGYTAGTKTQPKTQPLYVECKGVAAAPGASLAIDYSYVTGDFNYYVTATATTAKLELHLDQVATDLKYPIAEPLPGVIEKPDASIVAINKCLLALTNVKRTSTGLEFSWQTKNPSAYPTYVHIGTPAVIGADGIIYGFYESPSLADAPITPGGQTAEWKTDVVAPKDVTGLYIVVSVESKQQKLFSNHAVDISDK